MTNTTKTMLQREALNTGGKMITAMLKASEARDNGKGWQLLLTNEHIKELDKQAQALQEAITAHQNEPIMVLASMITIHGLKVAARGRAIKDENGKVTSKISKKTGEPYSFTPANLTALRILQQGINGTDGILDDLQQQTAMHIWEAISKGTATITTDESNSPRLTVTNDNDTDTIKAIYNTVQNYLYTHQQRHYKREYVPTIDENGIESHEHVTKAMRDYALGLESVNKCEIFQSLNAVLNEQETAVLWAMYDTKQVERAYSNNGKPAKKFVTRKKTLLELSKETGLTIQNIRTAQKNIRRKLSEEIGEYISPERKEELKIQAQNITAQFPHSVAKNISI